MTKTLEQYLALQHYSEAQLSKIKNIQFLPDEDNLWLYFEFHNSKKVKGEDVVEIKRVKRNITNLINNMETTYYTYVATEMLRENYSLVAIDGGWIVHGGEEPYQLNQESCTCLAFLNNKTKPCKHLIFLEWHLQYRNKCNNLKRMY